MESLRSESPVHTASTAELVKQALEEARELVKLEVRIARHELKEDFLRAGKAALAGGVAVVFLLLALGALTAAAILALGAGAIAASIVGAALALMGAGAGALAFSLLPKPPLDRTRQRMKDDLDQLKEHVA